MKKITQKTKYNIMCLSLSIITGLNIFFMKPDKIVIADSGKEHLQEIKNTDFLKICSRFPLYSALPGPLSRQCFSIVVAKLSMTR